VTEDCNCTLGGSGFNAVYKRHNGKWVKVKSYGNWISLQKAGGNMRFLCYANIQDQNNRPSVLTS